MNVLREEALRRRLLLVEDDRHSIDELRDIFTQQGYECEVALDFATARKILAERMMDLAVVNASLSAVSDEKLVQEFMAHDPSMCLVIYNGTGDKARQRRLRRMGADSYLSEASDLRAVGRAVQKVLEAKK